MISKFLTKAWEPLYLTPNEIILNLTILEKTYVILKSRKNEEKYWIS